MMDQRTTLVSPTNYTNSPDNSTLTTVTTQVLNNTWPFFLLVLPVLILVFVNVVLVLSVVLYDKLHQTFYYVIVSMSVGHMLTLLLFVPLLLARSLLQDFPFPSVLCQTWETVGAILSSVSVVHLCVLAYLCQTILVNPLRYKLWNSRGQILLTLTGCWGLSIVLAVPSIYFWSNVHRSNTGDKIPPLVLYGCGLLHSSYVYSKVLSCYGAGVVCFLGLFYRLTISIKYQHLIARKLRTTPPRTPVSKCSTPSTSNLTGPPFSNKHSKQSNGVIMAVHNASATHISDIVVHTNHLQSKENPCLDQMNDLNQPDSNNTQAFNGDIIMNIGSDRNQTFSHDIEGISDNDSINTVTDQTQTLGGVSPNNSKEEQDFTDTTTPIYATVNKRKDPDGQDNNGDTQLGKNVSESTPEIHKYIHRRRPEGESIKSRVNIRNNITKGRTKSKDFGAQPSDKDAHTSNESSPCSIQNHNDCDQQISITYNMDNDDEHFNDRLNNIGQIQDYESLHFNNSIDIDEDSWTQNPGPDLPPRGNNCTLKRPESVGSDLPPPAEWHKWSHPTYDNELSLTTTETDKNSSIEMLPLPAAVGPKNDLSNQSGDDSIELIPNELNPEDVHGGLDNPSYVASPTEDNREGTNECETKGNSSDKYHDKDVMEKMDINTSLSVDATNADIVNELVTVESQSDTSGTNCTKSTEASCSKHMAVLTKHPEKDMATVCDATVNIPEEHNSDNSDLKHEDVNKKNGNENEVISETGTNDETKTKNSEENKSQIKPSRPTILKKQAENASGISRAPSTKSVTFSDCIQHSEIESRSSSVRSAGTKTIRPNRNKRVPLKIDTSKAAASSSAKSSPSPTEYMSRININQGHKIQNRIQESKSTMMMILVMYVVHVLLTLPYMLYLVILALNRGTGTTGPQPALSQASMHALVALQWIGVCASVGNPLICWYMSEEFKKGYKEVYLNCCDRDQKYYRDRQKRFGMLKDS